MTYVIRYRHHHHQHAFRPRCIDNSKAFQTVFLYSDYNLYLTIFFGASFIVAEKYELWLSHLGEG